MTHGKTGHFQWSMRKFFKMNYQVTTTSLSDYLFDSMLISMLIVVIILSQIIATDNYRAIRAITGREIHFNEVSIVSDKQILVISLIVIIESEIDSQPKHNYFRHLILMRRRLRCRHWDIDCSAGVGNNQTWHQCMADILGSVDHIVAHNRTQWQVSQFVRTIAKHCTLCALVSDAPGN